jgi:Trk K+ transport system NAD-binding subunit
VTHGDGTNADCLRDAGIYHRGGAHRGYGAGSEQPRELPAGQGLLRGETHHCAREEPKEHPRFEQLGVDSVISSTARIAGSIDQELDWADVNALLTRQATHVRVREALVAPTCAL